jgi:hypothetical protein
MIFAEIMVQCSVVYNDCRWNSVRVQQSILIDGGISVMFSSLE